MTLILTVQDRVALGNKRGLSKQIAVKNIDGAVAPAYEMMCGAIDEFIDIEYGESVLQKIEQAQKSVSELIEAEGHAYICWLTPKCVTFEFQYGEHGPEKGGEVSLAQFKLAVQTYLQFLRDPERKLIEVPFPE